MCSALLSKASFVFWMDSSMGNAGISIPAGKKSYALSFVIQDKEKTLNDKVIDKTMKKIQLAIEQNFNAELR